MKFLSLNSNQKKHQQGVAAVEFALIAVILFTLLFGIMEMGRVLFMMNTTAEATRLGARIAVVCDRDNSVEFIKGRMTDIANFLPRDSINVNYVDSTSSGRTYITVSVIGVPVQSIVSLIPFNFEMPSFSTTLPRESMNSANNPICN